MSVETSFSRAIRGLERIQPLDARIAELARGQYGVAARWQLVAVGVDEDRIDRRLASGRLHRMHRGVYAVGHCVVPREGRWLAAVLACGPDAVLSHRSAAELWGMRRPGHGWMEVTAARKSGSFGGIRRHHSSLPEDEVTERGGIPVTGVSRTIFDLAAVQSVGAVERAMRDSERLRLDDRLSLEDLLARHPRRRGTVAIRECLRRRRELPPGVARGELEARFLDFLHREGIPRPSLNAWVVLGERRFQADCLWRDVRLIVELDGYETHGTRQAFEDDRGRDRRLLVAGFHVMHVTWRQLHEVPGEVASDLRAILGRAAPLGGRSEGSRQTGPNTSVRDNVQA